MKPIATILFAIIATTVAAQEAPILIKTGKLFDSRQKKFLANQEILVQGKIVKDVGTKLSVPKGAKVIDLSLYTVLPGLIDSHTHLFYLEPLKGNIALENLKMIAMDGDPLRTLRAYKRSLTFLDAGITTVKDLGNSGQFLDFALQKAIREGTLVGPRLYVSGPIISSVGGQLPGINREHEHLVSHEYRVVKSVEDAGLAVRENINYGADVIKICADNIPNNTTLSIAQMREIVNTAHRYDVKVTAHAISEVSVWEAIVAGVDGIEHGYQLSDTTLQLMAKKGVYLVPTDLSKDLIVKMFDGEGATAWKASQDDRLRRAIKQGVKIVAGSDNYIDFNMPQGNAAKHVLLSYFEAGMAPLDILAACTSTAAEFLGRSNRLGAITKDAFADIIAVEGDLEKDFAKTIFQIRFVMVNGAVYQDAIKVPNATATTK